MIYLGEYEIGADPTSIGFPSVANCRAIVIVTGSGLVGFHLFGTLTDAKKSAFVNFVNAQANANDKRALYIISKLSEHPADAIAAEVRTLKTALNYTGDVYVGDISSRGGLGVYVQFDTVNLSTCIVTARAWVDAQDSVAANKSPYNGANRATALGNPRPEMYSAVNVAGLTAVYPKKV